MIAGVTAADVVGADATFVCVHETGGTISCWGARGDGQLGAGLVGDPRTPVEVLGQHHPWPTTPSALSVHGLCVQRGVLRSKV